MILNLKYHQPTNQQTNKSTFTYFIFIYKLIQISSQSKIERLREKYYTVFLVRDDLIWMDRINSFIHLLIEKKNRCGCTRNGDNDSYSI